MPIDNTTNLNINNSDNIFGNRDVNDASAPTKTVELNPVNNNRGITEVSNADDDFITMFPDAPKPSLRQPDVPLERLAEQPVTLASEVAKMLNLSTQTTLEEFITACINKLTGDIGKIALDDKVREAGGNPGKFDSEMMDCMIALLTMDSKSKLIQTLRETLQAKINDRKATNQKMINKNVEIADKNAEEIKKQEAAKAKAKRWGIFGAILSAAAAIFACAITVASCGTAGPAAIAMTVLAISGCVGTVAGSACNIAGLCTDGDTSKGLQKAGMWLGIAGSVLSVASSIGSIWAASNQVSNILKLTGAVVSAGSGVANSTSQIVNGIAQKDLAAVEKELATMKMDLAKLDNQIELLSDMIDKIANGIQDFMKDLFQDEEEVSQMIRQMMQTSLDIGQNVKC